jgi:hypothetical protein
MDTACNTRGEEECCRILVRNPEENRHEEDSDKVGA